MDVIFGNMAIGNSLATVQSKDSAENSEILKRRNIYIVYILHRDIA